MADEHDDFERESHAPSDQVNDWHFFGQDYRLPEIDLPENTSLSTLYTALNNNRELYEQAQLSLEDAYIASAQNREIKLAIQAPTQNALMAYRNIRYLVPLINLRGGRAEFRDSESQSIHDAITQCHKRADKKAMSQSSNMLRPKLTAITLITALLIIITVIIIN